MSHPCIKPLGNRVLVKRAGAQLAHGKILLPDTAQEKPCQGSIVAVGPGKLEDDGHIEPVAVKIGDTIFFGAYAGMELKHHDGYLILSEDDILAVLG